jgi:CRP/FNR family transcriptional regulator, cyclic AMP receptor protein
VLLELPQSATVQALTEVEYFIIDNAIEVLRTHPDWLLQIARLLAQRVNTTTALLTREKREEGKDILVLSQQFMSSWGDPTI